MRLPDDIEELQIIANYYSACRSLRRMGWGSLVLGIISIGLGALAAYFIDPINLVLALIGTLLVCSGIWCLVLPGAEGAITNGVALILIGLWNLFNSVLNFAAGSPEPGHVPPIWPVIFGVFMISAGIQCLKRYARCARGLRYKATADEMEMIDALTKKIIKAYTRSDRDVIDFQVRSFPMQSQWLGWLDRNIAFFFDRRTRELMVAEKRDVSIKPQGDTDRGKPFKATVRIGDEKWQAVISRESFDGFRDWKFADDEDDDDRTEERERKRKRRRSDDSDEERPTGIQRRRTRDDDET